MNPKSCIRAVRLVFLAFGLGLSSWAPMVPFVKEHLGLDDAQLGLVFLFYGIGSLGTMPIAGQLIHWVGTRRLVIISGLLFAVTLPLLPFAPNPFLLAFFLFFFGIVTGLLNVAINGQAVDVELMSPNPIMSGMHCLFSLGGLIGSLFVGFLLGHGFSMISCALAVAGLIAIVLWSQWTELLPPKEQVIREQSRRFFVSRKTVFLATVCFIAFMSEGSMLDWSAEFLTSTYEYAPARAGIGYALFSVAMVMGRLVGDRMIRLFGPSSVFFAGCMISALGYFAIIFHGALGFLLIGFGASNLVPILFSSAGQFGRRSDYALAFITTGGYTGILLGPAFIGFLAQATTLSFSFAILACLLLSIGATTKFQGLKPSN